MTKQKIITTTPNQQILWSMVYLNTIPIRNLSHKTEKNVWGAIVRGAVVLLPRVSCILLHLIIFILMECRVYCYI